MKYIAEVYLHGDKGSMWDKGHQIGLKGSALDMFRHACTEIRLTLEVDMDTGMAEITHLDGRAISKEKTR